MKITKLDNRFKLYKTGLATYMTDVSAHDFCDVDRIMDEAYGMGQSIPQWRRHVPNQRDWFYSYKHVKTHMQRQISMNVLGQPVYSHSVEEKLIFRIYFRRHEQAMFLALKML